MAPTCTFYLTWKLLAELAHGIFPIFAFLLLRAKRAILSISCRLDLSIIPEI